ncbi:tyrosine-type recombinase/integrase [Leucobacter aridicollis]|uniref:tyrosine-type recombinase/integrase n=1 Tax=Leucobacter aridicollis TaxID=283878 RepID=UPI002167828C|nr:site-specific integrase [Leucobacter aridicollis]MCS3427582.1 integrase [Leucobacter aridicollis]
MVAIKNVAIKHSNAKPVPRLWGELVENYLDYLRAGGYPKTTIETRRQHLHFLARRIKLDPKSVTSEILIRWCSEQEWKPETRRGRNNTFRFFWKWAADQDLLDNVAVALPKVRQRQTIPRVAPETIYADALKDSDPKTRLILRLAAECGLRRGEIATIHVGRDLEEDVFGWSLFVKGKGEKQRIVPITASIARELLDLGWGWAFPGGVNGHISVEWVGRLATRVLRNGWTLHTLRARFATKAYDLDHDVFSVQALLGHASPETTKRYVRTDPRRLRKIVESVGS